MLHLINQPRLLPVKYGIRRLQTLLNYEDFQRVRCLAESLPLAPLLARQPRFAYKYLSRYSVASFSRATRLAALLHHYHFLAATVRPDFLGQLHSQPTIWRAQSGADEFAITLSYPPLVGFECELSLNFLVNGTVVQVVGFVIVPGAIVGVASAHALLFSQVQGVRSHAAALRHATKTLHDITPAALLVNAAYGLAAALGIGAAAGVSTEEQLGLADGHCFNYNGFWEQFRGERTPQGLYALAVPAPERSLHEIKHNHRARTLRKRHYKQQLREAVAAHAQLNFLP